MGQSYGGVREFCVARPPSVVFLICLLSFAFTALGLSFYFGQGKLVPDPDALDWNRFLMGTGKLHFCLTGSPATIREAPSEASSEAPSASVSVALRPFWIKRDKQQQQPLPTGFFTVRSHIKLSDMGRAVPHSFKSETANMTFRLPSGDDAEGEFGCVGLQASQSIIDTMNSGLDAPENCSSSPDAAMEAEAISGDHLPQGWCEDGKIFKLRFGTHPSWVVFIDDGDQLAIRLHLLVTSAFLFVLVGLVLTTIFVRGIFVRRHTVPHQQLRENL